MISYKDSGVNIDEGNALVNALKPLVQSTFNSQVIGGIGSFAGAYVLPSGYKEPVLLSSTDGVGTKLKLAIESNRFDGIGIDLVAMCVNDLICNFAMPLFFLDYFATGKLEKDKALKVITSIVDGCKMAGCALIGGESAEMPDMYAKDDFDIAGFSVGIAEKSDLISRRVVNGDILVALPSSGIHSNGYSLVRNVLFNHLKMDYNDIFDGVPLIETLLRPTHIYVDIFKNIMSHRLNPHLHALAHITGGGIVENLPRVLPKGALAEINKKAIRSVKIFELLSQYVADDEMYRTFNMGVGMILVVSRKVAQDIADLAQGYIIGEVKNGDGVRFV